ncbi:MAG: hypothetical protein IJX78_04980 [Bacilli bacterium]|nr:hypothetical protein [Bacilli bacterium]
MSKEKRMVLEQNKKELTFYYELIGVSTILLSLLALARLGLVGYYIMMAFRIMFGDWYFAFLLALLLFGIYCLFKHQPLNVKNMRSVGIILLMIAVLTISHFPMHEYVNQFGTSYLKMTFSLYLDYFKNYQEGMIVGGGIIGMLFFYLFYTLFSSVGTVVIVLFIGMVGVSFSFNKTIGESLGFIKRISLKVFKIFTKFGKTLKYGIVVKGKAQEEVKPKKKERFPKLTIDCLSEPFRRNYVITEEKHAVSLKKTIASVLNNMNVFYQGISYIVGEHVTTCKIETVSNINLDKLYLKLKSILSERFLITKDIDSPKIKIEIDNIDTNPPFIKTILLLQEKYTNNLKLGMGIDTNNELVEINFLEENNFLIIEANVDNVVKLMNSYILMLMIKLTKIKYEIKFFDVNNTYKQFEKWECYYKDLNFEFVGIGKDIEKRLELLNQYNCNDIYEYNKRSNDNFRIKFIFILNLEAILKKPKELEMLLYFLRVGSKCGYYFIVHYFDNYSLNSILDSLFMVKIFGKNSGKVGEQYIGIDPGNYLYEDEAFYLCKDELFRFSLVNITDDEQNKLQKLMEYDIKSLAK